MRSFTVLAALLSAITLGGVAWAGVSPTTGGQSMSGATIKAPAKSDPQTAEGEAKAEEPDQKR